MTIDSVDATTRSKKKHHPSADPREADAEADRDNDLAAGRVPRAPDVFGAMGGEPVLGTSAMQIGGPRGGSSRCGNPIGYGYCDGMIDQDDPVGRCTKCGVPTRAAWLENMAVVQGDYETGTWPSETKIKAQDGTMTIQGLAHVREAARLTLQRQIGAQFWQEHQIDPESWDFSERLRAKDKKLLGLMRELDKLIHQSFQRAGLLPHPGAL